MHFLSLQFLATAFFLEFSIACIWTPIDVLILTTLPKTLCKTLVWLGLNEAGEKAIKVPMAFLSCLLSFGFFILSLHITKALDVTLLSECGPSYFCDYVGDRLCQRVLNELPRMSTNVRGRGRRKKKRSRPRPRSSS
ncbi:uncharacterized protein [Venturia canescens]|uniref:uncharacterized protein n=1 Tax=Venturia canescens TaxID=32260 RepID=UPI001C9D5244|nr:uncharacterized protein LOC122411749 [Venturia canescens]